MLHLTASRFSTAMAALPLIFGAAGWTTASAEGVVNVYSARHYQVDEQVNRLFTERTGIEVRVVNAPANQLMERIKSEGSNSPADVLVTVDAGQMQRARAEGLLRPLNSGKLKEATPAGLRDPDGFWYPYTVRARVIMVAADRVGPNEITRYSDLADRKWRGRVLIRSSSSPYNQALTAAHLTAHGEDSTRAWVRGITRNLARPPQGGDRDQIKFVAAGLADVCVANTYYLGMMLNSTDAEERRLAGRIRVVFPDQEDRGAHVNVSAAGVARHAPNADNARRYLEFLVSPEVQALIVNATHEYPVNFDMTINPVLQSWGAFKPDTETFLKAGENLPRAIGILDAEGWK